MKVVDLLAALRASNIENIPQFSRIILIIDEFADLTLTTRSKEFEDKLMYAVRKHVTETKKK